MFTTCFMPTHNETDLCEMDLRVRVDRDGNLDLEVRNSWNGPWVECPKYWLMQAVIYLQTKCADELAEERTRAALDVTTYDREMARE